MPTGCHFVTRLSMRFRHDFGTATVSETVSESSGELEQIVLDFIGLCAYSGTRLARACYKPEHPLFPTAEKPVKSGETAPFLIIRVSMRWMCATMGCDLSIVKISSAIF